MVTGGRTTIALRVPDHPVARELLRRFAAVRPGRPAGIAAPSANRFGRVSPTSAAHVRADLGADVDLVLDGGPSRVGVESTIVDCTGASPVVLRVGGVSLERLELVLGTPVPVHEGTSGTSEIDAARAPGMLASHYAPAARVEVLERDAVVERARQLVAAGGRVVVLAPSVIDDLPAEAIELEPAGPADDYARVLYERLRQADRLGAAHLLAVPPPPGGVGDAIRDRLARAAASPG